MMWGLFLCISVLAQAIANVMNRVVMKTADKGMWEYAALSQILTGCIIGIYALAIGFEMPPLFELWSYFLVAVLLNVGANIFQNEALRTAEVSYFTIFTSVRILVSVAAAFLVLGERVTLWQGFGAVIMIAAIAVAFSRHFEWKWESWMGNAILYVLCSGLVFIVDARIVSETTNVSSYMAIAFFVPGVLTALMRPRIIPGMLRLAVSRHIVTMSIFSISYGIMAVTLWLAYQYGATASQMAPLRQSAVILTVIFAMLFLNERTHVMRKLFAALLAIFAVYLITLK